MNKKEHLLGMLWLYVSKNLSVIKCPAAAHQAWAEETAASCVHAPLFILIKASVASSRLG